MTLPCTIYQRPNGRKTEIEMGNIRSADEEWYKQNHIIVSMEDLPNGTIVLYAQYDEIEGEPQEVTYVVPFTQSCEDAMAILRGRVEDIRKETPHP